MSDTEALVDRLAGDDEDLKKQLLAYGRSVEAEHKLNVELDLLEREVGNDVMAAAYKRLRSRGIDPDSASQEELLEAMKAVSR